MRTRSEDTGPALPVMPPTAPVEYRYAHYSAAQALKVDRDDRGFSLNRGRYSSPYLRLGNGTKVWSVFDLEPQVAPHTELGREIEQLKRARSRNRRALILGIGGAAAGVALMGLGIALKDESKPVAIVSISIGAVGFFGGMGYWVFASREKAERAVDDSLVRSYNASLAATLRLCVSGMYLVNCDDGAPVAVPPTLVP
jgi:hypothetical protein